MEEIWKPIKDCLGYDVSNMGRIRTYWKKGREGGLSEQPQSIRRTQVNSNGYLFVSLRCSKNKPKAFNVHSLVADAFLGPKPPGLYARHNDGNKQNNIVTNLRYDTNSNNQLDAIIHRGGRPKRNKMKETVLTILAATIWRPVEISQ